MNSLLCILDREQDRNLESSPFWRIKLRTGTENFPQGPSKFLGPMQLTAQLRYTPQLSYSCSTWSLGTCEWNTSHSPVHAKQKKGQQAIIHFPQSLVISWGHAQPPEEDISLGIPSLHQEKAPPCEPKPRTWTMFRKKYHRPWVKEIRKQFLREVLLLYLSPAHPYSLLCQKLTAITYCSFISPPVRNLSQQISVQRFRSDKRDDCVWAFPLYPADGTKLFLENYYYSHVKKNTLGVIPAGQTKGCNSCSSMDHAIPPTAERWAHINISTGEPTVELEPVHWCLREPWGKRAWKQGEKVEEEECL